MLPIKSLIILFAPTALALSGNSAAFFASAPAVTAAPALEQALDCDYSYCDENHISWCFHFIPFTTIDPTLGPMPGETRVSVGVKSQNAIPRFHNIPGPAPIHALFNTAKGKHDRDTVVTWCASRLLPELENDTGAHSSDNLRCSNSHVVDAENHTSLVNFFLLFVTPDSTVVCSGSRLPRPLSTDQGISPADLGTDDGPWSPQCHGPCNTDKTNQYSGRLDSAHKERGKHASSKEKKRKEPCALESESRDSQLVQPGGLVVFIFIVVTSSRGLSWNVVDRLAVVRGSNKEGKEYVRKQTHNRVDEKCKGTNSSRLLIKFVELLWGHMRIRFKVWLYIDLPDIRGCVEQQRKESNPGAELDLANPLDLRRQTLDRLENGEEERDHAMLLFLGRPVKARVSLLDEGSAHKHRQSEGHTSDSTKYLKLRLSEEPKVTSQVNIPSNISDNVAESSNSTSHGVGRLLLVSWRAVDNESTDGGLNGINGEVEDIDTNNCNHDSCGLDAL
ncbi:hypothetical protein HG531_011702 [Fusarium graminearum]|nr:hypothetical protein HG531_011702 [Fusarium graminearum]